MDHIVIDIIGKTSPLIRGLGVQGSLPTIQSTSSESAATTSFARKKRSCDEFVDEGVKNYSDEVDIDTTAVDYNQGTKSQPQTSGKVNYTCLYFKLHYNTISHNQIFMVCNN